MKFSNVIGEGRSPVTRLPKRQRDERPTEIALLLHREEALPKYLADYAVHGLLRAYHGHDPWPAPRIRWRNVGFAKHSEIQPLQLRLILLSLTFGNISRAEAVKAVMAYGISQSSAYRLIRLPSRRNRDTAAEALCGFRFHEAQPREERHAAYPGRFIMVGHPIDPRKAVGVVDTKSGTAFTVGKDYCRDLHRPIEVIKGAAVQPGQIVLVRYHSRPSVSGGL